MPVQPSYPGVYIEEIPSAVRTITGVPTSIAAFVGTAPRGPDSTAVSVGSLIDYERTFGRIDASPMNMTVGLYYQNGGSEALIVRVVGKDEQAATLTLPKQKGAAAPKLAALSKGAWGGNLLARVDYSERADGTTTYNLTLRDRASGRTEHYPAVSTTQTSPRTLARLLKASALAVVVADPLAMPGKHADVPLGTDPFAPVSPPSQTAPSTQTPAPGPSPEGTEPTAATPTPVATPPPATPRRTTPDTTAADAAPRFDTFTFEGSAKNAAGAVDPDDYAPETEDSGIFALTEHNVFFNILVLVPPGIDDLRPSTLAKAAKIAFDKRAFMLLDPPRDWVDTNAALSGRDTLFMPFDEPSRRNSALYFPRLVLDQLSPAATQSIDVSSFPPAGALAGLYARTDRDRGVWKAPAGLATSIGGTIGLTDVLTDFDSGRLNPIAVNALRTMPIVGNVVWGARTGVGDDLEASQWKYVPVRRLALYIEESLFRGTQWVVFEPNDEPLWAQIRLNTGVFMNTLFRQGAFQGRTATDAYFVKCDRETNPQADIDRGIVNIIVGFAPLKPAEFVIIQLQQISPSLEV
jgi:hypothetical protein